jgi:hypothetical protein
MSRQKQRVNPFDKAYQPAVKEDEGDVSDPDELSEAYDAIEEAIKLLDQAQQILSDSIITGLQLPGWNAGGWIEGYVIDQIEAWTGGGADSLVDVLDKIEEAQQQEPEEPTDEDLAAIEAENEDEGI